LHDFMDTAKKLSKRIYFVKYLALLGISCLFVSCATVKEIPQNEHTHFIENIPFYPQDKFQCGPAALAMVLRYWGINVSPDDIAREIFSETARGTLDIDMLLFAQKKKLNAVQYNGSIDDLEKNIESGHPVIVLVDYGFSLYKRHHYMVVHGYNEQGLIVNSGRNKNKFIFQEDFLKIWGKTAYWTLLITPEKSKQ